MNSVAGAGRIVTGAEYVRQITALESDRRTRSAFHHLVARIAPAGARLFDFGCGTGMDARFYAEHDYKVAAYDVDARMCEFFSGHCHELMAAGSIVLLRGGYREFLAGDFPAPQTVDLVTSNFAPLNLIDDLRELFSKFHAITAPQGRVLVSVLSPYFLGDARYGWWWRNLARLWRTGRYALPGAQAPIVRRRLIDYARQSAPYFELRGVFRGLPTRGRRPRDDMPGADRDGAAWLRLTTSRYMFLLFEKRPGGTRLC